MMYQLVLQWPVEQIGYEKLIEVEDLLIDELPAKDNVDGHDSGAGESNIFVLTEYPRECWGRVKLVLESNGLALNVRVAYRQLTENEYVILWPETLNRFNVS